MEMSSVLVVPKISPHYISITFATILVGSPPGDMSLSEPTMVSLLTHIGISRPQWVIWQFRLTIEGVFSSKQLLTVLKTI